MEEGMSLDWVKSASCVGAELVRVWIFFNVCQRWLLWVFWFTVWRNKSQFAVCLLVIKLEMILFRIWICSGSLKTICGFVYATLFVLWSLNQWREVLVITSHVLVISTFCWLGWRSWYSVRWWEVTYNEVLKLWLHFLCECWPTGFPVVYVCCFGGCVDWVD